MQALELKIPPPLVALLVGLAMWGFAQIPPYWIIEPLGCYILFGATAAVGVIFALAGFIAFGMARTTINPLNPAKTTALVTAGIYGITRNPMYVGLLLVLLAWAIFLQSLSVWLGPVIFFLWINYLQI